MITEIVMPKMGESINEGTILEWRKKVGDTIELDEILLEIGTDKVDSEIPSPCEGVIVEILAKPNDVIEVGKVIAKIDSEKKVNSKQSKDKKLIDTLKLDDSLKDKKNKSDKSNVVLNEKNKFYSPVVMKILSENNISLNQLENINGTGRAGRITKKDMIQFIENMNNKKVEEKTVSSIKINKGEDIPEFDIKSKIETIKTVSPGKVQELSHMRKAISNHMMKSINTSAHVHLMTEIDVTEIVNFVKANQNSFYEKENFTLTYTPFILMSTIKALKNHPLVNASLINDSIHYHKHINIGLAVSIEDGLMVPTIFNCEEKNFLGLCRSVNEIANRTRSNEITPDELGGSTFSITNFGVFGIMAGTPIINQPNVGILGIGSIKKAPVVIESSKGEDAIAIRNILVASLGFDHRLIDGAGGSNFLKEIKKNIESMNLKDLV